jgi:hypothetical protein
VRINAKQRFQGMFLGETLLHFIDPVFCFNVDRL